MKLYDQDEVKSILYDCIEKIENSEIGGGILSRVARGKKDEVLMVFAENIYNELLKDNGQNLQLKGKSIIKSMDTFHKDIIKYHNRTFNYLDADKRKLLTDKVWEFLKTKDRGREMSEDISDDKKKKVAEMAVLNYIVWGDDPKIMWGGGEDGLLEFADLWRESKMLLEISKEVMKVHSNMIIEKSRKRLDFISSIIESDDKLHQNNIDYDTDLKAKSSLDENNQLSRKLNFS